MRATELGVGRRLLHILHGESREALLTVDSPIFDYSHIIRGGLIFHHFLDYSLFILMVFKYFFASFKKLAAIKTITMPIGKAATILTD